MPHLGPKTLAVHYPQRLEGIAAGDSVAIAVEKAP